MSDGPPGVRVPRTATRRWRLALPPPTWLGASAEVLAAGLPLVNRRGSDDVQDRNAYRLYADMLWAAIFSAVAAFNGAFAVRLGASNELVGLLSSLPPLVVALLILVAMVVLGAAASFGRNF